MISTLVFLSLASIFMFSWDMVLLSCFMMVLISFVNMHMNFSLNLESSVFMIESFNSFLIFLSVVIIFLSLTNSFWLKINSFSKVVMSLNLFLVLAFSWKDLLGFYFFFESSLIPTLILIMVWGYQPERLQAGTYMMLYTVFASLPLLMLILYFFNKSSDLSIYNFKLLGLEMSTFMLMIFVMAFLVKLPIFSAHLWLPKAHVEAPLSGSMILAGVLLKLGGYGLYLTNQCFNFSSLNLMSVSISFLSMWGGLFAALMCLQQTDMKAMVAYSSVAHMSLVISGIFLNSVWGEYCAKVTMIAHGFTSSALFVLVNMSYKKLLSRSFLTAGGLLGMYPKMSFLWFLFCSINMAVPPSYNLVGELMLLPSLYIYSVMLVIIMGLVMFFSATYNMFLYTQINHGMANPLINSGSAYYSADYLGLFLHLLTFIMLLKLNLFSTEIC
uniref:NADH-ubiquinone oxidoreductase chain 4 n=1 Tax=Vertigo pusilla TaxID=1282417 RepID=A0A0A6ZAE9_9EUPU|nr:NADH dehydrogenase subunit 4 [Vertigo pusilla]AGC52886.1 NADH dehydrogenase subunit 4 [Vertigo pusilla]